MVLLDLSAAFDTVDHELLLHKLDTEFNVRGTVLDWFKSYLEHRSQTIQISQTSSRTHVLRHGVPQGSILGPVLFTLYTSALGKLIGSHHINYMFYADDTQLYITFHPTDLDYAVTKMEACIRDVRLWMCRNFLKLNDDKTEVIIFRSPLVVHPGLESVSLRVGDNIVNTKPVVRNLGVYMDCHLSMDHHVNYLCKTTMYHIRQVGLLRKYLDKSATEKLIHAVISSRLDYANSLLFGVCSNHFSRLQTIQNTAARIVLRANRHSHITPLLNELHWLPVKQRVNYKLLLLAFRGLKLGTPAYLSDVLHPTTRVRSSRSRYLFQLNVPASRTKTFGDCTFHHAAPCLWNSLPPKLRSLDSLDQFKRSLKTFLFSQCF